MARLTLKEGGTSAVVGALDIATEKFDSPVGPSSVNEVYRILASLGAGVGSVYLRNPALKESLGTVALVSIPMLERVIWNRAQGLKRTARMIPRMTQHQAVLAPRGLTLEESPSIF